MSRPVAGLACRIRVPVRQYQAVALVARETTHVIRLLHADPGLSIDVEELDRFETAEEYCERLASFLDLPTLLLAGSGRPADAEPEEAKAPAPRRQRPAKGRRPRFLMRRRAGEVVSLRRVEGHEIIART